MVAKLAEKGWQNLHSGVPFPKVLGKTLQEHVVTPWWTVAVASNILSLCWEFFAHMSWVVASMTKTNQADNKIASGLDSLLREDMIRSDTWIMTKTDQADNKIASGLDSLLREDMIKSDTSLLGNFYTDFLNSHLQFYQGTDPETHLPGYLIRHVHARCFVMKKQMKMLRSSDTGDTFLSNSFDLLMHSRTTPVLTSKLRAHWRQKRMSKSPARKNAVFLLGRMPVSQLEQTRGVAKCQCHSWNRQEE
jgi:hypothetical protein